MSGEGAGSQLPAVAGRREDGVWRVWISERGHVISLDPARARQLADDIVKICAVIEAKPAPGSHEGLIDQFFARDQSGGTDDQGPASC